MEGYEIRRVTSGDWRALRHLRLAALLETPLAYCERWSEAAALDDDAWRARAARGADGGDSYQVMAWDGARPVATAVGYVDDAGGHLVSVHVAPDVRGAGLLERLVDEVAHWVRGHAAAALLLEVHEDNARARAAYRRLGFVETGRRRPYPLDPSGDELEMVLSLAG